MGIAGGSLLGRSETYLYGEKVKAYLRRGARPLPGFGRYPNEEIGYGVLCAGDSLPRWGRTKCSHGRVVTVTGRLRCHGKCNVIRLP